MIYKDFNGIKLSALGLGTMRLPLNSEDSSDINEEKTAEMVDYALKSGINYFDTAYPYHGGKSEVVIGKILNKYPRDSYYLATKFPGFDLDKSSRVAEIFEEQLAKTGMEYFDFYLFHNVCERNIDWYTDEKLGIFNYLIEQKRNGRIKHLGFSSHGSYDTVKRFLEAYGSELEFCQLQINYIDWDFQDAKRRVELLKEYNIPVWVMEPLRGGKLANLADQFADRLKELRPEEGIPAWGFRFLQSIPEVTMTLSGMSNMEQLEDNIKTFSEDKPLNPEEMKCVLDLGAEMVQKSALLCTACRYCTEKCPRGLDIPKLLRIYNDYVFSGSVDLAKKGLKDIPEDKLPTACVGCRACESVCPQLIKISEAMREFAGKL